MRRRRIISSSLGCRLKMFANESPGEKFPPLAFEYGRFHPLLDALYPEYVPDATIAWADAGGL